MTGLRALTPAVQQGLVTAVEKGIPIETACEQLGISRQEVTDWLAIASENRSTWRTGTPVSDPAKEQIYALSVEIARARANREARMLENIMETGFQAGRSGIPEWRAHAWVLNNHPAYRERYREQRQLQVEGNARVNHYHQQVRTLPNSSLKELIPAEYRELLPDDPESPSQVDDNQG